jgi:NTE family protein
MDPQFEGGSEGLAAAARALRSAWIFSGAPDEAIAELAALCQPRWIEAGVYLFHEGAPADYVYVVGDGSLEVVRAAPSGGRELILNVLESGTVGELALLRGETRSAGIRARRRSLIYAIDGKQFMDFVRRWPETAVATARTIAEGMVRSEDRARSSARKILWGVIRDARMPADFGLRIAEGAIAHLPGMAEGSRIIVIDTAQRPSTRLDRGVRIEVRALPADATSGAVAQLAQAALADAQLVLVLAGAGRLDELSRRLAGLVVGVGQEAPRLATGARALELIASGKPSATRVRVGPPWPVVARRVARMLAGRSVGIALGGGGGRGIGHLGVLQVLEELEVEVDFIAGTSMGSVVGGLWQANGVPGAAKVFLDNARPLDWVRMIDFRSAFSGVIIGRKLGKLIGAALSTPNIEDLPIPYAAVALDLDSGEELAITEGPIVDAVMASVSIPGVFAPHEYRPPGSVRRRRLIDGGVTNNVPVDVVRALGADRVIGSHVIKRRSADASIDDAAGQSWVYKRLLQIPTIARAVTVLKSQLLGVDRTGHRSVLTADLPLFVDTSPYGFLELWRAHEFMQAGRRAAEASAAQLRLLASPSGSSAAVASPVAAPLSGTATSPAAGTPPSPTASSDAQGAARAR